jgi:glutamate synthase (NADPH/NADH) large chain
VQETGSAWGHNLLDNFADYIGKFWMVKPKAANLDSLLKLTKQSPQ